MTRLPQRVCVIGCPGSGKSTLSLKLGELFGLPVTHLDKLHWKSGWVEGTREEFDEAHAALIALERFLIDGCYSRTLKCRLTRADFVVFLDFNSVVCVLGVLKRIISARGRTRPDMTQGCPEKLNMEFIRYVLTFNRKKRAMLYDALIESGVEYVVLNNRRAVKNFIKRMEAQ